MIIDSHAHLASSKVLPPEFNEGWKNSILAGLGLENDADAAESLECLFEEMNNDENGQILIREMDAAGIDKSVLLIIDFGFSYKRMKDSIEEIYQIHRSISEASDRFIVYAGIDPRRGKEGLDLFEKSLREWGFQGLKIYPPCGYSPSDKALFPFYELCRAYKVPVLTHIGPSSCNLSFEFTAPSWIDDAARNFQDVKYILGHAGVTMFQDAALQAGFRPNVYLDISGFQSELKNGEFQRIIQWNLAKGLGKKLLFGTDWPIHRNFGSQKRWVDEVRNLETAGVLDSSQLSDLFSRNFSRIHPAAVLL